MLLKCFVQYIFTTFSQRCNDVLETDYISNRAVIIPRTLVGNITSKAAVSFRLIISREIGEEANILGCLHVDNIEHLMVYEAHSFCIIMVWGVQLWKKLQFNSWQSTFR